MRAFLYPVIKHQCISFIRKRRKVVSIERHMPPEELTFIPTPPGEFDRLIKQLDQDQQELVQLRFGLGLRLGEIGAALGLPLGTIKSRLHNILKLLRKNHTQEKK
jgi:RNA polymerase sigma-70 factor (ECF subfamily)